MDNFNSKESYGWVECTLCGQWVHDKCMQVDAAKYSMNDDFPCGCDIIRNGLVPLKRSVSVAFISTSNRMHIYIYALVHLPICPLWISDNLLLVFWCLPDIRKIGTWFIKVILTQIETFFERVLLIQKQKYLPHINYTCTYILSLI